MLWFKCDEIIPGVAIAVAFLAVCLGGFLQVYESTPVPEKEELCRMAESADGNAENFRRTEKTALVLGYTGETGRLVLDELNKNKLFKKVFLVGRRIVDLSPDFGPEFEQKKVNFDNLDAYTEAFEGADVCFCCIGTTRARSGEAGFVKVDHDYVLKAAELLKAGGCKHFHYMSTAAADHKSSFLYPRTKGQVEEALKVMHFQRLSVYRPAVLLVDREESRPMEKVARFFLNPISKVFPTAISVPIETVARAIVNNAVAPSEKTFEIYENKAIHLMGGEPGLCPATKTQESPKTK